MRTFCLICMMACAGLVLDAQIRIVPREQLEAVNNPKLSDAAQALQFKTTHIKAEPMSEDDGIRTFHYEYVNIGPDTIKVSRLVTSCSCLIAVSNDMVILPGMKSQINVRYNPKGHPGRFERKVFLYTDGCENPSAILKLSVDVERGKDLSGLYPVSMGSIRLRRKEVSVVRGQRAVERCPFVNLSGKPLKLACETAMLPACLHFRTEPEVVEDGENGEIIILYDPSKGGAREKMPVILKGLGVPPSQASIVVKVVM